ncbi:MAG: hypothetical protein Ct9H300mP11_24360 [Chloroflexota bacterium]|nr:MAG: hypothetical protein Ct9H300mP11_24360 [Chloroflexota bacterium]
MYPACIISSCTISNLFQAIVALKAWVESVISLLEYLGQISHQV